MAIAKNGQFIAIYHIYIFSSLMSAGYCRVCSCYFLILFVGENRIDAGGHFAHVAITTEGAR